MRKKRRGILLIALLSFVTAGLVWVLIQPSEPVYHGRKLSQWLDDYNSAGSMDKTGPVSDAIRAMGTNTLPFLVANIEHEDSPLKMKFFAFAAKHRGLKLPIYGADPYRETSILALNALGSNAAPIFPELLEIAEQTNNSWRGMLSLLGSGPSAVPTLEMACQSTNANVRADAVLMMCIMKTTGSPYFSWGYQKAPVNGRPMLGLGWGAGPQQVGEMVNLLADPNPAVRRASAEAIAGYNAPVYAGVDKKAIPRLIEVSKDSDPAVRHAAEEALKKLDPDAAAKAGIK